MLASGTRLGPYEVTGLIGEGGMGQVFRATDTRLGRNVAIKMLPASLAGDPVRRERFEREARSVSRLEHPHICPVYDVGDHQGHLYIVMPLLDGETLAQRLTKGPLSITHTLEFGIQVAEALAAAHRAGIVHRDLKPGNVMLTRAGAHLLDFGLARPVSQQSAMAPTIADRASLTTEGTVLGTLHYMAPEQLDGRDVDTRADIFSFGAVLFEMVTGLKAFDGESPARVMSAILRDEPTRVSTIVPITPAGLDALIHTCLAKDPNDRWQGLSDVARQLRWLRSSLSSGKSGSGPLPSGVVQRPSPPRRATWLRPALLIAGGLLAAAAGALAARWIAAPASAPTPPRLHALMLPPDGHHLTNGLSLSPDGRRLAFVATDPGGRRQLWVRALDEPTARRLEGTEEVSDPFWSPDSRHLAFFAASKLRRVPADGGAATIITDAGAGGGGSWGAGDVIVYSPYQQGGLMRVPASGGRPEAATTVDQARGETHHLYPAFLPGGRHFVFYVNSRERGLYVASIEDAARQRLFDPDPALPPGAAVTPGLYAAGRLYYVRDRVLMAVGFDPGSQRTAGEPVKVVDTVDYEPPGQAAFTVAGDLLVYRARPDPPTAVMAWVDRAGRDVAMVDMPAGSFRSMSITPDDRMASIDRRDAQGLSSVWLVDLAQGGTEQVPSAYWAGDPLWSHDGRTLAFSVAADSPPNLLIRSDGGRGAERRLTRDSAIQYANDFTPDGTRVLFQRFSNDTGWDLHIVGTGEGASPQRVLQTPANEARGRISPDGRWIAYGSDESGQMEIYIARFPELQPRTRLSDSGGSRPMWRRDGREIFYATSGGAVMAAAFDPAAGQASKPSLLFQAGLYLGLYAPGADGKRILIARPATGGTPVPMELRVRPLG
jgi:serine/threonine protein kinase